MSPFTVIHSQDHHLNKTHKNDSYDEKGEFEEGDIFVSALFGFDSETKGNEKDIAVEFSGRLGYLFSNTLTGGIKLSLDNEIIEGTLHKNIDVSHTLIGLFGRYDFTPGHKFSIFGELGFDYLSSKSKDGNLEIKENGYKIGLSPGITYFLNKHFAIEAFWGALQYQTKKVNGEHESTHEFNIGIDFEHINFGLAYKF
ncbi:Outer membrane protein beta-barrel domain-containing protein [Tenacibaculum sp. MAR_2010_89]|nr:Outer membrane protein beta-barrel domain-containing protein [Tenacibaculum sp. MAR_2010_89]